jgi:hypothetical protein
VTDENGEGFKDVTKWSIVFYNCDKKEDIRIINIFSGIKTFKDFYDECAKHGLIF